MNRRSLETCAVLAAILLGCTPGVLAQQDQAASSQTQEPAKTWNDNHLLGVLPAYNVANASEVKPLTKEEKFRMFWLAAKDPVTIAGLGLQAGIEQANNANAGYGQGTEAYFKRYGAAWTDATTGRLFRTVVYPTLFREDPRYFRLGESASPKKRVGYALSRVFITRTDSQGSSFNWAKLSASFSSAALSNIYYPAHNRGVGLTLTNVAISYGMEAGLNGLREFWSDLRRHGS